MPFKNLVILDHPLASDYITRIRDKHTSNLDFRFCVDKLSYILAYESAKEVLLKNRKIKTPLSGYNGKEISGNIVLVPILRAGLGLLNGFSQVYPNAMVSHIGIFRMKKLCSR